MNFNLKLKKIRTFRKMTQKELSEKIGLTDQHRIVQYEKGVRVPKKDLVDKMAKALDVNSYTLYDTAGRDASVYYHDNDSWPAHAPVCMWFDYGVLNDFLKEWVIPRPLRYTAAPTAVDANIKPAVCINIMPKRILRKTR